MTDNEEVASWDSSTKHSVREVELYLRKSLISVIDKNLGEGYSKEHPKLLERFMHQNAFRFYSTAMKVANVLIEDVQYRHCWKCIAEEMQMTETEKDFKDESSRKIDRLLATGVPAEDIVAVLEQLIEILEAGIEERALAGKATDG